MSVAKYVVLGLLRERSGYPYELARRFQRRVGPAWHVNDGHVYLAVADLEKQGLIEPRPSVAGHGGTGGRRRVMRLTERGLEELERWLADPIHEDVGRIRSELMAKLLLADGAHAQIVLDGLERYGRARIEDAEQLVGSRETLREACGWEAVLVELLREAALSARIAEIHWLRTARELLVRLADQQRPARERLPAEPRDGVGESSDEEMARILSELRGRHDELLGA